MVESDEIYERLAVLRPQHRGLRIARVNRLGVQGKWDELSAAGRSDRTRSNRSRYGATDARGGVWQLGRCMVPLAAISHPSPRGRSAIDHKVAKPQRATL